MEEKYDLKHMILKTDRSCVRKKVMEQCSEVETSMTRDQNRVNRNVRKE